MTKLPVEADFWLQKGQNGGKEYFCKCKSPHYISHLLFLGCMAITAERPAPTRGVYNA